MNQRTEAQQDRLIIEARALVARHGLTVSDAEWIMAEDGGSIRQVAFGYHDEIFTIVPITFDGRLADPMDWRS